MDNWDIIGHEWAVQSLARDAVSERVRHAYLLLGPTGIGKSTLALAFAQTLLCRDDDRRCNQLVAAHTHPDLSLIVPEESGKIIRTAKISIEVIRELIYTLSLRPVESQRRVAVIADFDSASRGAANALLKTLEEPPGDTILILTAESEDRLLPTITSRCERLTLRPLPLAQVQSALQTRWGLPAEQAALLTHLSAGRLGWAVRMHQDEDAQPRRRRYLEDMRTLLSASRVARFDYAQTLAGDREQLLEALEVWQSWWRDVMLCSTGGQTPLVNIDDEAHVRQVASQMQPAIAAQAVAAIRQTRQHLARNVNSRLALEVLLLELPNI